MPATVLILVCSELVEKFYIFKRRSVIDFNTGRRIKVSSNHRHLGSMLDQNSMHHDIDFEMLIEFAAAVAELGTSCCSCLLQPLHYWPHLMHLSLLMLHLLTEYFALFALVVKGCDPELV